MNKIRISCRGLIRHQDKVLLQNIDDRDFWNVPGGGFELSDTSVTDCVIREILEETGMRTEVDRFLLVQEFQMEDVEQIELFFLLKPLDIEEYTEYHTDPDAPDTKNKLQWFTVSEVKDLLVKPKYLQLNFKTILESNTNFFTQNLNKPHSKVQP